MAYFDHYANTKKTKLGGWLVVKSKEFDFKYIEKYFGDKDGEILEIGAGYGETASMFLKNNYKNYDVVEPNAIMRDKLVKMGVRRAKDYYIPVLQETDSSYDLIIVSNVFEHLNDRNEAEQFIKDVYRVLKKSGIIFIQSPDFYDCGKDFFNVDYSHNYVTTVRRTMQIFLNYNLKTINYKYKYSCFTGCGGLLLSKLVKMLTFFAKGNGFDAKFYKLRFTFIRCFNIVAQKID